MEVMPTGFYPFESFAEPKITDDIEAHEREIQDYINTLGAIFAQLADEFIHAL